MPTNKNAAIRYQTLDKCFRDRRHRYYLEDLIDKCEEALYYYNGVGGVSRRQVFEDIKFMESETGWSIPLERHQDGRRVYYRYSDPDFTINAQPLTDEEANQLRTVIVTLDRIQELQVEESVAFIPNKEIDFEHYFDDVFGVTIPPSDVKKIRVVLQFSKKQYPYIVSKPLHHSQKIVDDENRILAVEVRPTYEFTQLILSFGKDVNVLEPAPYRQEIIDNIRKNLQNYDEMQIDCTDK